MLGKTHRKARGIFKKIRHAEDKLRRRAINLGKKRDLRRGSGYLGNGICGEPPAMGCGQKMGCRMHDAGESSGSTILRGGLKKGEKRGGGRAARDSSTKNKNVLSHLFSVKKRRKKKKRFDTEQTRKS